MTGFRKTQQQRRDNVLILWPYVAERLVLEVLSGPIMPPGHPRRSAPATILKLLGWVHVENAGRLSFFIKSGI